MNKYSATLLILLSWFTLSFVRFEPPFAMDCAIENTSFMGGEKMVFTAYYNWQFIWIPAGEAHFNLKENTDSYEVSVYGTTYKSYESFFRVKDYFYSKIDKKTLYPTNFVRHIEEGKYRKFDSIAFDQVKQKAYSFVGKTKATAVKKEIPFETCTHDLLSVLYFLRNINVSQYKKGQYIPTSVLFDEEKFPIKVRYEGKEAKKKVKDLGTFNTVKVIPDLVVGEVFKDGDKMKIWVSDDANKLPLYIESPLKVGSAKAILKSYSKLRNPLTSKVGK
jgi:hypothetical protein